MLANRTWRGVLRRLSGASGVVIVKLEFYSIAASQSRVPMASPEYLVSTSYLIPHS